MSFVRVMPTIFCSRAEPPEPGNLAELLFRQRVQRGVGRDAEVAGERQLEADAEAVAASAAITGFAQRAGAAMFHASFETCSGDASRKPLMSPPLEKCSPCPRTTMTRTRVVRVERLERDAQLLAREHADDVERRPVEDDVGAFARRVDLDTEAVEVGGQGGGGVFQF